MKFLGGFLKFLSTLIMIVATVVCILVAVDAAVTEAYLAMGLIWICALLIAMIIWVTGSVLTTVSNLKKRTAQLEQKLENLLLAQVSAYRMTPNPVVKNETNAEMQIAEKPVPEISVPETPVIVKEERKNTVTVTEPTLDAPKKKRKKGLLFGIIGGICLLCIIAVFVVIAKIKGNDLFADQQIPDINPAIDEELSYGEIELPMEENGNSFEESDEMKQFYAEIIPGELQGVWVDTSDEGLLSLYAFQDNRIDTFVVNVGVGAGSVLSGTYSVENGSLQYDFGNSTGYSYFTYQDNTLILSNANNMEMSRLSAAALIEYLWQEEESGNNNGVICLADLVINYYGDSEECIIAIDKKEATYATIEAMGQASLQNLRTDYDKVQGITWYEHKDQPKYTDICCYIYPYIGRMDSGFTWLRVKLNYTDAQTDNGWIFFEKVIFSVDGTNTTKYFDRSELVRDNDTEVWEVADFEPSSSEIQLLKSIANSTETIIRFEGDDYYEDHIVTKKEKAAIIDVLTAYDYLNK